MPTSSDESVTYPSDDDFLDILAVKFARLEGCTCEPTPFADDRDRHRLMHADGCVLAIWNPGALEALIDELEADRDLLAMRPTEHSKP